VPYPKNMPAYCRRFGLNSYYAGKHWSERKRDADEMHWLVRAAMSRAGIPHRCCERPVQITFRHNTRMDVDNHAVIEKYIVDAMKGWLLQEDSKRFYRRKISEYWDGDGVEVVVEEI
jgi:hypothetical protein